MIRSFRQNKSQESEFTSKKSVSFTIVFSICILVIILLATINFVNIFSSRLFEEQAINSNNSYIGLASSSIDEKIEYVNSLLYKYINDSTIAELSMMQNNSYEKTLKKIKIRQNISSDALLNEIILDIYVIDSKHNNIISAKGSDSLETFLEFSSFKNSDLSKNSNIGSTKITRDVLRKFDGASLDILLFSYSSTYFRIDIIIDYNQFVKNINSIKHSSESIFLIFDHSGSIFLTTDTSIDYSEIYKKLNTIDGKDHANIKISGKNFITNVRKSQTAGWQYVVLYPYSEIIKKVSTLNYVYRISYLIVIFIGVAATLYYRRKFYSPISYILNKYTNDNVVRQKNEFVALKKILDDSMHENETIKNFMNKNNRFIRKKLLENLLFGNKSIKYSDKLEYFPEFIHNKFAFAKLTLQNSSYDSILKLANDLSSGFTDMHLIYEPIIVTDTLYIIMNFSINMNGVVAVLNTELTAYNSSGMNAICFLSNEVCNLDDLMFAHEEVLQVEIYRNINSACSVFTMDNVIMETKHMPCLLKHEADLLNTINRGNCQQLDEIVPKVSFSSRNISAKEAEEMLSYLNYLIKKVLYQRGISINEVLSVRDFEEYDRMNAMIFHTEKEKLLFNVCNRITEYIQSSLGNKEDEVIKYINNNFQKNISLDYLAHEFSMNPSYLSTYIRKKSGKSYTEYIGDLRISAAKKMICSTGKSISEIAFELGFENSSSFIRFFKKLEGCTPGQYSKSVVIKDY